MKIKFNLGWILAIAAAVIVAAMGFMSFYYLFGGNLIGPIIVAVFLFVLPLVANMLLVPAKECAKPFYFHKAAVMEASMLAVMIFLFIVSMPLVNHFFTVNSRTEKIASEVANQRFQLDEMQQSYGNHVENREYNYRIYLQEVLENKALDMVTYEKVFQNGSNDIELMVREMHNNISLEGLSDSAPTVYESDQVRWWQLPSIMNNVEGISTALEKNYNLMVKRDHNFTKDNPAEGDYWSYSYTTINDIMDNFTVSDGFVTSLWTVLSVLLGYFLILLPYLVAERDSRNGGLFAELRKNEDDKDDDSMFYGNIGKL